MAIVAYGGMPTDRIFTRITFSNWEHARITLWNDSTLYGLHDTDVERTWVDEAWDNYEKPQSAGQLNLFGMTQ